MSMLTGSASNQNDLLLKLKEWLELIGWTIDLWTPAPGGTLTQAILIAHPIGGGPNRRPYCMFRTFGDLSTPYYTIEMRVASGYSASLAWSSQLEISPPVYLSSSNAAMPFWFYANSRRLIMVCKIGTSYVSSYSGMFLPFALPSEQDRPFYVGANSSYVQMQATDNSFLNNFIADPGQGCAHFLNRNLSWRSMFNRSASGSTDLVSYFASLSDPCLWPKKPCPSGYGSASGGGSFASNGMFNLRPNLFGEMPLMQCHICDPLENSNYGAILGALDGVFAASGFDRVTEQIVTAGGQDFRIFQNGIRSSQNHFMAIQEI